jgi:archaetidylinositol phosphate synthase
MSDIKNHQRVNDILLGPLERPALRWLAAHMPAWINSDILTAIGVLGSVVIAVSYWLTNYNRNFLWIASLGFVINWFGDSLDGTLARYRKLERPKYGFFVDHTVDAFSEVMIFLGLGLSPYFKYELANLALIGYLLVSVLVYVRTCVVGKFVISYGRFGPTEIRVIAILANTFIFFFGAPQVSILGWAFNSLDAVLVVITVILFGIFIVTTIRQAIELARLEAHEREIG